MRFLFQALLVAALATTSLSACTEQASSPTAAATASSSAEQREATAAQIARQNLATFDTLDFDVFSNQKWDRLAESHSADILVHWPDGHTTRGLERHTSDLKALFVYAPDTRIKEHPVKIASGEWTSVTGFMEGTFTKPMTLPDGTVIQPNGKAFKLPMATIGHWTNGVMDEEYLFWDNQTYMTQLGLAG